MGLMLLTYFPLASHLLGLNLPINKLQLEPYKSFRDNPIILLDEQIEKVSRNWSMSSHQSVVQ